MDWGGFKGGGVVARLGRTELVARLTGVCVALAKGISHQIDKQINSFGGAVVRGWVCFTTEGLK